MGWKLSASPNKAYYYYAGMCFTTRHLLQVHKPTSHTHTSEPNQSYGHRLGISLQALGNNRLTCSFQTLLVSIFRLAPYTLKIPTVLSETESLATTQKMYVGGGEAPLNRK